MEIFIRILVACRDSEEKTVDIEVIHIYYAANPRLVCRSTIPMLKTLLTAPHYRYRH